MLQGVGCQSEDHWSLLRRGLRLTVEIGVRLTGRVKSCRSNVRVLQNWAQVACKHSDTLYGDRHRTCRPEGLHRTEEAVSRFCDLCGKTVAA